MKMQPNDLQSPGYASKPLCPKYLVEFRRVENPQASFRVKRNFAEFYLAGNLI